MSDIGKMTRPTVKAVLYMQMEMFTKAFGTMTKPRVEALTSM